MTTRKRKLTRRHLKTFDTFATEAVLTAMELGGLGRIDASGHARIQGKNGVSITIARDTSAPHCQGNVTADLKRAFPELRTNGVTKEEITVSTKPTATDTTTTEMLECPAKRCDQEFSSMNRLREHIKAEHAVCKWQDEEGPCDGGPNGGPFIGDDGRSVAGHTNTYHKGHQPWMQNREQAAAKRAETVARKKKALENVKLTPVAQVMSNGSISPVAEVVSNGHVATAPVESLKAPTLKAPAAVEVPVAVPSNGDAGDAEAKLALIQKILGENPEVARLKKELADVNAHLALVREQSLRLQEAVGLDVGDDDN